MQGSPSSFNLHMNRWVAWWVMIRLVAKMTMVGFHAGVLKYLRLRESGIHAQFAPDLLHYIAPGGRGSLIDVREHDVNGKFWNREFKRPRADENKGAYSISRFEAHSSFAEQLGRKFDDRDVDHAAPCRCIRPSSSIMKPGNLKLTKHFCATAFWFESDCIFLQRQYGLRICKFHFFQILKSWR